MAARSHPQLGVQPETNEWYTPPRIFHALGITFDLDPCSPPGGLHWVPAARSYTYLDDGLAQPWEGRVWLNPPYGPHVLDWLSKLADHGDGIALVFARTDVRWFQQLAPRADVLCLISGRIRFVAPYGRPEKAAAAAPSCLLAFGDECARALLASKLGLCYTLVS